MKCYGSLINRLEENRMIVPEITVGTGMTEYLWSDRHAYEVIAVRDQKHITVRELDHEYIGNRGDYSNDWKLIPNENNPEMDMVRIGDYWYWTVTVTAEEIEGKDPCDILRLCVSGFDPDKIRAKGKQTKRSRANVSFGKAEYYYDYEF